MPPDVTPNSPATTGSPAAPTPAASPAVAPASSSPTPAAAPASPTDAKPAAAVSPEPAKTEPAKAPAALTDAPAEAVKPEAEGEKKPEAKPSVPEKYEFKFPDGFQADEKRIGELSEFAKTKGWDQDTAQAALDMHLKELKAQTDGIYNQWHDMQRTWQSEVGADKEIGNGQNGLKPEAAKQVARAIDALPPALGQEFRKALNFTGAGNNPAVVKALHFLGQFFTEGKPVTGKPAGGAPKRAADVFYGGNKSNAA